MAYSSVTGYPFNDDRAAGYGPEPAAGQYRLIVSEPGTAEVDWVRIIDGEFIPIRTRREAEQRRADFLRTHPDGSARIECGPGAGEED